MEFQPEKELDQAAAVHCEMIGVFFEGWPTWPRELPKQPPSGQPQAVAGQANGSALLRFGWTISNYGLLCQLQVGFQAELDIGSS